MIVYANISKAFKKLLELIKEFSKVPDSKPIYKVIITDNTSNKHLENEKY